MKSSRGADMSEVSHQDADDVPRQTFRNEVIGWPGILVVAVAVLYVSIYLATLDPVSFASRSAFFRTERYRLPLLSLQDCDSPTGKLFAPLQYMDAHCIRPNYWHRGAEWKLWDQIE